MARPYWSGQVTISLVSFGVKLFVATEAKSQISFHQIDRRTGERVRHQKVLASAIETQPDEAAAQADVVGKSEIVKGYEYSKGHYVTIEPEELAHLRVPSKHTMEVTQFVGEDEIDPEFYEKPYFVVPENEGPDRGLPHRPQSPPGNQKGRHHQDRLRWPRAHRRARARRQRRPLRHRRHRRHDGLHDPLRRRAPQARRVLRRHQAPLHRQGIARPRQRTHQAPHRTSSTPKSSSMATKSRSKNSSKPSSSTCPSPRTSNPPQPRGKVINLMDALRKSVSGGAAAQQEAPAKRSSKRSAAAEKKTVSISSGTKKPPKSEKSARSTHKRKSA